MINPMLLGYLAHKFIAPEPVPVKTELMVWQSMEAAMEEPKGLLRRWLFNWVLVRVNAYRRELEMLDRFGIEYHSYSKAETDSEPQLDTVDYEITIHG